MATPAPDTQTPSVVDAPSRTVAVPGAALALRTLGGPPGETPLLALTHLGATLDSWDPEVVDPLATDRRVILLGYRGVGASTGAVRDRFEDMAADVIAAVRILGYRRVDLLGLSMGGMVAQEILRQAPDLVDRVVLVGTGPPGGPGLTSMTGAFLRGTLRGLFTFTHPTTLLFFTRTPAGRAAAASYRSRLARRRTGRDGSAGPAVFRRQLRAVSRWGGRTPAPLTFTGPVLILHGDHDRMVPPPNADLLLACFPAAEARVFTDSGHGVASQNHRTATDLIRQFLHRAPTDAPEPDTSTKEYSP